MICFKYAIIVVGRGILYENFRGYPYRLAPRFPPVGPPLSRLISQQWAPVWGPGVSKMTPVWSNNR